MRCYFCSRFAVYIVVGWKRKTVYWTAVVLLLAALVLLARYDNWLRLKYSYPILTLVFSALIVYIEARWLSVILKEPLAPMLGLSCTAEVVSSLLGSWLGPNGSGPPFYWVLSHLAYFEQSLRDEWGIVFWDSTGEFLSHVLIITAVTVFFAVLFKTLVYIIGLR